MTGEINRGLTGVLTRGLAWRMTGCISGGISGELAGETTEGISGGITGELTGGLSGELVLRVAGRTSEGISRVQGRISHRSSFSIPAMICCIPENRPSDSCVV